MSEHKRDADRIGLVIDIKLTRKDDSEFNFKSRNISDTGVFLEFETSPYDFSVDEEVILQVASLMDDEPPPPVPSIIVRICNDGLGLMFKESV